MVYCIFTYSEDEQLVQLCVQRLREADRAAVVYLADDARAPMRRVPNDCHRVTTRFPRGGSLNGMGAVLGVLDSLCWCMQHAGASYIVKLDADTMLCHVEWLQEHPEAEYLACEKLEAFRPAGNCYRITYEAARAALEYLQGRQRDGMTNPGWYWPEDQTIFDALRMVNRRCALVPYSLRLSQGMGDTIPLPAQLATASVIHCGEPVKDASGAIARASRPHVLLRMRILSDSIDKQKQDTEHD
ncbi:MAG: hypothetical protein IJA81_00135 [Akkermansia sp.]|nr:hypothetical protein [Akkermansia sp.]